MLCCPTSWRRCRPCRTPNQPTPLRHSGLLLTSLVLVPFFALPDPLALTPDRLDPPSAEHLLGTDPLGRDIAARLVAATPASLGLALAGLSVAIVLGLCTALPAAWSGTQPTARLL